MAASCTASIRHNSIHNHRVKNKKREYNFTTRSCSTVLLHTVNPEMATAKQLLLWSVLVAAIVIITVRYMSGYGVASAAFRALR